MPESPVPFMDISLIRRIAQRSFLEGQRYATSRMHARLRQMPAQAAPEPVLDQIIAEESEADSAG